MLSSRRLLSEPAKIFRTRSANGCIGASSLTSESRNRGSRRCDTSRVIRGYRPAITLNQLSLPLVYGVGLQNERLTVQPVRVELPSSKLIVGTVRRPDESTLRFHCPIRHHFSARTGQRL